MILIPQYYLLSGILQKLIVHFYLFLSNFCFASTEGPGNYYENLNKTHVKINLLLLLLLFHNFTHHSYDISQTLPRVLCTVNSNVIARFIDAFGIEVLQAIFQKLLFFTKRDFLRSISRQIRFGDNFEIILS